MIKKILLCLFLSFSSLPAKEYIARVTYYWTGHQTSTGAKPKSGHTIAVDPKIIPYGSKVHIPTLNKTYYALDTGPDVVKKKASKGKNIVVDIYCASKAEAQMHIKRFPMYMPIKVIKK
jgi:3D (Asp-Asp-Asp) domain-containing protein